MPVKWTYTDFRTTFEVLCVVSLCLLLPFQLSEAKEGADECLFVPDFAEPLVTPAFGEVASSGAGALGAVGLDNQPPEEMVAIIISMGFQRNLAIQALKATVSSWFTGFVFCALCLCMLRCLWNVYKNPVSGWWAWNYPGRVWDAWLLWSVFHWNGEVWKAVRKTSLIFIPVEK